MANMKMVSEQMKIDTSWLHAEVTISITDSCFRRIDFLFHFEEELRKIETSYEEGHAV